MKKIILIFVGLIFGIGTTVYAVSGGFTVPQGGTGNTSFPAGQCLKGNGTGALTWGACGGGSSINATSTEPLMGSWLVATSTTATSTFAGPLSFSSGNMGSVVIPSKLDRTCATDDTDHIQSAINRLNADGGGTVYIPAPSASCITNYGGYKITGLTLKSGVSLKGDTPQVGTGADGWQTGAPSGGTWLNCNGATNCLTGNNLSGANLYDIGIYNWTGTGIVIGGDSVVGGNNMMWTDVVMTGTSTNNGTSAGFNLYNTVLLDMNHVQVYNVNTCGYFTSQGSWTTGNGQINYLYCSTYQKSAVAGNQNTPGLVLQALTPSSGFATVNNLLSFYSLQINTYGANIAPIIQLQGISGATVNNHSFYDTDIEVGTAVSCMSADYADNNYYSMKNAGGCGGGSINFSANASYNTFFGYNGNPTINDSGSQNYYTGTLNALPATGNGVVNILGGGLKLQGNAITVVGATTFSTYLRNNATLEQNATSTFTPDVRIKNGLYMTPSTPTSVGSPLGGQIYLGDSNFWTPQYIDSEPGIGAVYSPVYGVAADLGFYTYTGGQDSRTEQMRIINGKVGIGTTTPGTALSIANTGANTINISATATSTFGSGINIRTGCFAINNVCISGGAGITDAPSDGSTYGRLNGAWSAISLTGGSGVGTSTNPFMATYFVATSTTATSNFSGNMMFPTWSTKINFVDSGAYIQRTNAISDVFQMVGADNVAITATGANGVDINAPTGNIALSTQAGGTVGINSFLKVEAIYPPGDSIQGFQIDQFGGVNPIFNVDTINSRIGISSTTPAARLSINAPLNGLGFYLAGYANNTADILRISTSTLTSTTTAFIIDSNGNVLIGTTTRASSAYLTVHGSMQADTITATSSTATSTFAGGLSVAGSSGLTVLQNGRVGIGGAPSVIYPLAVTGIATISSQIYVPSVYDYNSGNNSRIDFGGSSKYISLNTNNIERVRVISTGNVGIGTTSPWGLLSLAATTTGATNPMFLVSTSTATATSTAFIIDSNGKMGIGTTTPSQQLSVQGNVLVHGQITSDSEWIPEIVGPGPGVATSTAMTIDWNTGKSFQLQLGNTNVTVAFTNILPGKTIIVYTVNSYNAPVASTTFTGTNIIWTDVHIQPLSTTLTGWTDAWVCVGHNATSTSVGAYAECKWNGAH